MQQQTLRKAYCFEGKGLHTGKVSHMSIKPAPINTGILFHRIDLGENAFIEALADYVSNTARSTTIAKGEISVVTIEHIMSALTGMGIDNALIEIDNVEVPILDGSAKPYTDAIWKDGIVAQEAERNYIVIDKPIVINREETGTTVLIEPADEPSYDIQIDFNSKVVGVQTAHWDPSMVYAKEIGCCRTFVFFHEIEYLYKNNLIKGGDVDNAIVIVEYPVSNEQLDHMSKLFNVPNLEKCDNGYLSNLQLRYSNECARHKMLDLIGDLRLSGGFLKAKVTAVKTGHAVNIKAAQAVRSQIINK